MKLSISSFLILLVLWMTCCSSTDNTVDPNFGMEEEEMQETTEGVAEVTDVSVSGGANQYTFSVTISSPDLGCNQYTDWWEVIDLDGNLLYRRILAHSHVNEQPFTRAGGPVAISEDTEVYIRAHMNTTSYGSKVFKGSVSNGFSSEDLDVEFAKSLEETDPLPTGCAF
ncbi:hypothetical protein FEE95_16245 [Maribacter algarum]|uniref:Lipoprotein n=1 Tax=Maribacter algarum (ex Zhang et al. 2020) TaxID=2578118 RepID=A0A5S3PNX8_9FLAO|nr:hypothetical protein [Maribacter algarum]TMM56174.1 hypothetical protein FEE95_16245 [Maribacter algarum]